MCQQHSANMEQTDRGASIITDSKKVGEWGGSMSFYNISKCQHMDGGGCGRAKNEGRREEGGWV